MKIALVSVGVVIALLSIALVSEPRNSETLSDNVNTQTSITVINGELKSNKATLLDVRTREEFESGHIKGAELHDSNRITSGDLPVVDKDRKIYIYCRSGNRSSESTKVLKDAGFTNVINIGGIKDVQELGGEII